MGKYSFVFYDPAQAEKVLPQMYDILFTNMSRIAPTGNAYEDDKRTWMAYRTSPQGEERKILLMYLDETLVGYFQYGVEGDVLLADEIEITPAQQRTLLFYRFFRFITGILPKNISSIRAYINKQNSNSQAIAGKLGLKAVGENASGHSWLYEGDIKGLSKYIK